MNKAQIANLEREITLLINRADHRDERIAKAMDAGDTKAVARMERADEKDLGKLAGIDLILNCLGYRRHWDIETDRCCLQKIG